MGRWHQAPVRVCLAGEDLDWLGSHVCCCVAVSLLTRARLSGATRRYDGEYLGSVWQVIGEQCADAPDRPPNIEVEAVGPVGGGLASSSALTICLIGACFEYLGRSPSPARVLEVAYEAEFRITNGGGMDQLSIITGGATYIRGSGAGVPTDRKSVV